MFYADEVRTLRGWCACRINSKQILSQTFVPITLKQWSQIDLKLIYCIRDVVETT